MTESPEELAAVEQLLAESDALRGWLARLAAADAVAPDSVRDRVRRDYQKRLDQLTAGLRAHGDVISAKLADDRREHAELLAHATAAREALAEAELRHLVGEYDGERFESEQTRHGSDVETYSLGLDAVTERIARLAQVYALVSATPPESSVEPGTPSEGELPEPDVHVITGVTAELTAIADLAPDADPDDVLAIFDDPSHRDARRTATQETGPLSFRPSGTTTDPPRPSAPPQGRARPFESAPPLGIPAADVPPRFVRPAEHNRPAPAPPAAPVAVPAVTEARAEPAAELFADEIVATGPVPEPVVVPVGRTLRCGECGAMNRPLEWYCEKCGAELTTV
jgi:hypothetical protein